MIMYVHRVNIKKGATDFYTITFTNMFGFLWFLVHNFANEY